MERSRKPVDRQATFDTDARKKGNLKLPVIDSKDDLVNSYNDTNAKRNTINKLNAKGKPKSNEQTSDKPNTNSHLSKNGHVASVSQSTNKTVKGSTVQPNASKQAKAEPQVTSNKDKSTKPTAANHNSVNNVPTNSNTNSTVTKSTSLSKSIEAKLAKKEAATDKTLNPKGTDQSKNVSPRHPANADADKGEKVAKASVLNKVNRSRSKSPTKRDPSPEKKGPEDFRQPRTDPSVNRNNFKPATVHQTSVNAKPEIHVVQKQNDKQNDKLNQERSRSINSVNTDTSKSKASLSPRRVPNNSRTGSNKTEEHSSPNNNTPKETLLKQPIKGHSKTKDSLISSSSEPHSNTLTPSLEPPKSKSIKTTSPKFAISPRDTSKQRKKSNDTIVSRSTNSEETDTANVSSTLTDNKKQTYVLSPASTKVDYQKSTPNRGSQFGRLSPTNETIEPIKLEPRQSVERSRMDGRESYEQIYAERVTLINGEHTYKKRIKQLEDEANDFLKAIEDLRNENRHLRGRSDRSSDMTIQGLGDNTQSEKWAALEKENVKLTNKIKDLQRDMKSVANDEEVRNLKAQVVQLQSDNQKVNDENEELRSTNEDNIRKMKVLEKEKKSLETNATSVDSEKLDKIHNLHNEHQELAKQLKDSHTKTRQLEKKVEVIEYENEALSEALATKKAELNEILGVMKDENKFDNELKDLKNQILKLNKDKKDIEMTKNRERRIISDKLEETKKSLEQVTCELDEMKIKHDQADKEKRKLKTELAPIKKKCDELDTQTGQLKEEVERLKRQLKESNEKYTKMINDTENASSDLQGTKDQLEKFNKELQATVTDKEDQISKLINQLDSMREERDIDKKRVNEEKEKVTKEMDKLEQYQNTNKRLETDLKRFVDKIDDARLKEKQLELQLEDKTFQLSNLEQQVFEMNMKLDNNTKRMGDLDREKREMEKEKREWDVKKDKLDDIEASNKRLLEENKRLRNQLELTSYGSTGKRPTDRIRGDKGISEAWVNDKSSAQTAIYVTKENERKRVHIVQPNVQKKKHPFSKANPVKPAKPLNNRKLDKSKSPSRSMEDIRKAAELRTPESEYSLPELSRDARMTVGYGAFGGYRDIHKDRIRAAHKKVY